MGTGAIIPVSLPKLRFKTYRGATRGDIGLNVQLFWRDKTKISLIQTIEDTTINEVGAYTLVNGTIGFIVAERFRIQFIVNNLFDREMPYPAIVRRSFGAFDILGRSYLVTASASF